MECKQSSADENNSWSVQESDVAEPALKRPCPAQNQPDIEPVKRINPDLIRRAVFQDLKEPVVFRGYLQNSVHDSKGAPLWPCMRWDLTEWGKLFGDDVLKFRMGLRVKGQTRLSAPQWETTCLKAEMTFSEFVQWSEGQRTCLTSCGQEVNCSDYWAYFDYFYLKQLAAAGKMNDTLDWGLFGFPERGPADSTLWIGTTGANTPCHIDTYGCNLVAQIIGRKRWVLFPKCQSQFLSPTRLPYEESSIYSEVGFPFPNVASHPKLLHSTPYVVTLEPGDVLFVPKQWWHFVENMEFAVSINTWLELPSDHEERVKECLVMYQIASLCQGLDSVDLLKAVFNPNMVDVATMTSQELLNLLVSRVFDASGTETESVCQNTVISDTSSGVKTLGQLVQAVDKVVVEQEGTDWDSREWCAKHSVEKVCYVPFSEYLDSHLKCANQVEGRQEVSVDKANPCVKTVDSDLDEDQSAVRLSQIKLLIDAFTDHRVIDLLKIVIDEKLSQHSD